MEEGGASFGPPGREAQEAHGAPTATSPAVPAAPRPWVALILLTFLVALAYSQTVGFDLVWDDHTHFVDFPTARGRLGWWEIFTSATSAYFGQVPGNDRMYRPLLAVAILLDRAVWGLHPGGYHVSSALAHLAVALLVWRLAWWLTGSAWAALASGALMAVHPAAVGAVAFASARMDILVGLWMAAITLLMRGCLGPRGNLRLAGALGAFAGALGSKETATVVPAFLTWVAWAYPAWFAPPDAPARRAALAGRILTFWAVLGLYATFRRSIIPGFVPDPRGLADPAAQALRVLVAVASYVEMTLIPRPAAADIRMAPPLGPADGRVLLGFAAVALILGGLLWLRRRQPAAAVALGWYAVALIPLANIVPVYPGFEVYVVERALYPALVGWCLFLGVGVHTGWRAAGRRPEWPGRLPLWMGAAVLTALLLVTVVKAGAWRDDVTLWEATIASHPESVGARVPLAAALAREGRLAEAQAVIREAADMFSRDPWVAYMQGWIADRRGARQQALVYYERAIAFGKEDELIYSQVALVAVRLGERERAHQWFALAAQRFPRVAWPQVGLGWYAERTGRADLAHERYGSAERLEPRSPDRLVFWGRLLAADGRPHEAARAFQDALRLDPSFLPARRGLAAAVEQEGRFADAAVQWREIAALLPAGEYRERTLARARRLESLATRGPGEDAPPRDPLGLKDPGAGARARPGAALSADGR